MRNHRLDQLMRIVESLPALPTGHVNLLRYLDDPDCSQLVIGELISQDPALAACVLRVANSSFYGMLGRVATIPQAVVLLGTHAVRSIVLGAGVFRSLAFDERHWRCATLNVWSHSLQTAVAARGLAQRFPASRMDADAAFTAGLLHDIGKLLFVRHMSNTYEEVLERHRSEGQPLCDLERDAFHVDHAHLGAALGEKWNFPQQLNQVIARHHSGPAVSANDTMLQIIELADVLARLTAPRASGQVCVLVDRISNLLQDFVGDSHVRQIVLQVAPIPTADARRCYANGNGTADHKAGARFGADEISVALDLQSSTLREAIVLVCLSLGWTPISDSGAGCGHVLITDNDCDRDRIVSSRPTIWVDELLRGRAGDRQGCLDVLELQQRVMQGLGERNLSDVHHRSGIWNSLDVSLVEDHVI
ncbi:MAG: HDOD domain-containing protein [Pirellulaceae bacterium]|nr:HDOD domain-containing protein [Planctomycetales bacterium]